MLTPLSGSHILNDLKDWYGEQCMKWDLSINESIELLLQFVRAWIAMLILDVSDDEEAKRMASKYVHPMPDAELDIPDNLEGLDDASTMES